MIYELMLKNTPVLEWESDSPQDPPLAAWVLRSDLLPFILRGNAERLAGERHIFNFVVGRRSYSAPRLASEFLGALSFENPNTDNNTFNSAWIRRGTAFTDCYWIKRADESICWEDVSLRGNYNAGDFSESLLPNELDSLRKGYGFWHRAADGEMYFCKRKGADMEVMISRLLDKTVIPHVRYEYFTADGATLCRSRCMCDDEVSVVSAGALWYYMAQTVKESPFVKLINSYADDTFFLMNTWDYLIDNRDRSQENWGFLYNSDTTEILGCHPLIDHADAFGEGQAAAKSMIFRGRDMLEIARRSNARCPLAFTRFYEGDFTKREYYEAFCERLERL